MRRKELGVRRKELGVRRKELGVRSEELGVIDDFCKAKIYNYFFVLKKHFINS